MKRKHPIDEYFRKELEGHKTAPSASVWEKIEAQTESKSTKKSGVYLLRAAVITLLVGLSTYFYFDTNSAKLMNVEPEKTAPVATVDESSARTETTTEDANDKSGEEEKDETSSEKPAVKEQSPAKAKPAKLPTPQVGNRQRFVDNTSLSDGLLDVTDEQILVAEEEPLIIEELKVAEKPKRSRVRVKLSPNTIQSFYVEADTKAENKDRDLGNRMLAYANNQVSNLVNGRKLELPKTQSKPQLEFNLPRFFN